MTKEELLPEDCRAVLRDLDRDIVTNVDANFPEQLKLNSSRILVGFILHERSLHKAMRIPEIIRTALAVADTRAATVPQKGSIDEHGNCTNCMDDYEGCEVCNPRVPQRKKPHYYFNPFNGQIELSPVGVRVKAAAEKAELVEALKAAEEKLTGCKPDGSRREDLELQRYAGWDALVMVRAAIAKATAVAVKS